MYLLIKSTKLLQNQGGKWRKTPEQKQKTTKTDNIRTSERSKEEQIKQAITRSIAKERKRETTQIKKIQNEEVHFKEKEKDMNNNTLPQDIDFENNNAEKKPVLESKKAKNTEKWPGVRNLGVMKELQGSTGVYSGVEADWAETKKSLSKIGVEIGEDKLALPSEFIAIMKKLIASRSTEEESKCEKSSISAISFQGNVAGMVVSPPVPERASSEQTFQERGPIPGSKPRVPESNISESCETHAGDIAELCGKQRKKTTNIFSIGEKVSNYKAKKREGRRLRRCKSEGSLDISEKSQTIKESGRGKSCSVDDVRRVQGKHGDMKSVEGVESGKRPKKLIKSFWDRIRRKRSKNEGVDVGSEVVKKEHGITEFEKDNGQKSDVEEKKTPTLLVMSQTKVLGAKEKQFMKSPEKNGTDCDVNEATGRSQEIAKQSKKIKETNAVEKTKPVRIQRRRKLGVAYSNMEAIKVGKSFQSKEVVTKHTMKVNQNADAGHVEETNHVGKDTEFSGANHVERANQVPKASHVGEANEVRESDHVGKSSAAATVHFVERVHEILEASDVERSNEILEAGQVDETCQVQEDDVLGIKQVETSEFCSQTEHEMDWLDDWTVIEMDDLKPLYVDRANETKDGGSTKRTERTKSRSNRGAMAASSERNSDMNAIINAISPGYAVCGYVPLVSNFHGGEAFKPFNLSAGIQWFTKSCF